MFVGEGLGENSSLSTRLGINEKVVCFTCPSPTVKWPKTRQVGTVYRARHGRPPREAAEAAFDIVCTHRSGIDFHKIGTFLSVLLGHCEGLSKPDMDILRDGVAGTEQRRMDDAEVRHSYVLSYVVRI